MATLAAGVRYSRKLCHAAGTDEDGQSDLLAEEGCPGVDLEHVLEDPWAEQDLVVGRPEQAKDRSGHSRQLPLPQADRGFIDSTHLLSPSVYSSVPPLE